MEERQVFSRAPLRVKCWSGKKERHSMYVGYEKNNTYKYYVFIWMLIYSL